MSNFVGEASMHQNPQNCHTNILKLVIRKFLRLVFVHSYFTASFYIINIKHLLAVNLANIPQF